LPAASGATCGSTITNEPELRLLVVGESSAVGVGVSTQDEALASQLARRLSADLGKGVQWRALGRIGVTVSEATQEFAESLRHERADIVIVALGVNDTLHLNPPQRWYRELRTFTRYLQANVGCKLIVLSPIPPLWKYRCLPQPLRSAIGLHAFLMDRASRRLAHDEPGLLYVPVPLDDQQHLLCRDRFHPSGAGYDLLASYLARAVAKELTERGTTAPLSTANKPAPLTPCLQRVQSPVAGCDDASLLHRPCPP
jgi:lysophospholipase L1-like esterase